MKRLILVWVMILCLVPLGAWADGEGDEISEKSWIKRSELNDSSTIVEEFHSVKYDEMGLPVSYRTVYMSWMLDHLYTYHRGIIVDSVVLDPNDNKPDQSLLANLAVPFLEYDFAFDFDDFGNPSALRMTPQTETEALEFTFENQYENGILVCAKMTPAIDPSDSLPVYNLLGHFDGYRNALLDFGRQSYQNKDGKLIRAERSIGSGIGSGIVLVTIEEYQYEGDHLTQATQISYTRGLPDTHKVETNYHFDLDGRLTSITESNGDSGETIVISTAYAEAEDEHGQKYDLGTMTVADPEQQMDFDPSEAFVSCYWHDNGKLAEMVISPSAQVRLVMRYDCQGNETYNELSISAGTTERIVTKTNYLYRDWTKMELR